MKDQLSLLKSSPPTTPSLGGGFRLRYGVSGALSPDGDLSPGALPTPAPEDDLLPDTLPKDQVSKVIQERLKRQEAAILKRAGVTSLEELEAKATKARELEQRAAEAERKRLEESGQYKDLWEKTTAEKDAEIARLNAAMRDKEEAERNARLDAQIERAAARATAPDQVALIMKSQGLIKWDEATAAPYVADAQGRRATDGKGNPLSLEDGVAGWLAKNPHFLRAAGGNGAGTPSTGAKVSGVVLDDGEEEFDPSRRHDPDHIRRARKSIMRLQQAQHKR